MLFYTQSLYLNANTKYSIHCQISTHLLSQLVVTNLMPFVPDLISLIFVLVPFMQIFLLEQPLIFQYDL